MSITNYGELKTKVAAFANLSNNTEFVANVPDFIALTEASIRRDVRVLDMLKTETGSLVGGAIPLPARMVDVRALKIDNYGAIDYIDPLQFYDLDTRQYPAGYTITQDQILVAGGGTSPYTLHFWQAYEPLASDPDLNWLLTNAPDLYLFGALANGYEFMRDIDGFSRNATRYKTVVEELNSKARASLFSGPARVRPRVVA